jgi:hypothetical protein
MHIVIGIWEYPERGLLLSTKPWYGDHRMSQDDPNSEREDGISRRQLVAAGAAGWATVGVAGCNRLADPGPPNQGNGDDGGNGDGGNGNGNGGNGDGVQTTAPTGNTTVTNETTATSPDPGGETTEAPTTTSGGGGCASIRRFASGMDVGMHVEIFDDATGDALGAGAVEGVTVEFPDADFGPLELNWEGDHEAHSTTSWGGKVETSEETESGTYRYEITVDKGDERETVVDEFTVV